MASEYTDEPSPRRVSRLDDKFVDLVAKDALEPERAAFVRAHLEEFYRDASA